jgi:pimeloyl-ACP methyl ester carboxylesterase
LTSVGHQVRNQRPFAGGFPEGLLLYQTVAELRKRPEVADQIDQVHLLGVSFGGLLCGIAAYCEGVQQAGVVDGAVFALSPPLDLKTLFENISVLPLIHDRIHDGYVVQGRDRFVSKANLGLSERDLAELGFDSYVPKVAFPYCQKIYPELKAQFPDLKPFENPDDVYAVSSLRPFLGRLRVPYFYMFAYDDPVLSPEDHFHQMLKRCSNPLVDGMLLADGGHLGFDLVCDFPFSAYVAERYFRYWSTLPKSVGSGANRSSKTENQKAPPLALRPKPG